MTLTAPVFISYRRGDSDGDAALLARLLREELATDSVFLDVSSIDLGQTWPDEIRDALARSNTILVVIGPAWLTVSDKWGRRRLDSEGDWVRLEIERALQEDKTVIPVLVGGAELPSAEALPEGLRALPNKQKIDIRRDYCGHDVQLLITKFKTGDRSSGRQLAHDVAAAIARQVSLCKERDLKFRSPHLITALLTMSPSFASTCFEVVRRGFAAELTHLTDTYFARQGERPTEQGFVAFELEGHPVIRTAFALAEGEGAVTVDERHVLLAFLDSASAFNNRIRRDLGVTDYARLHKTVSSNRPGYVGVGLTPASLFD